MSQKPSASPYTSSLTFVLDRSVARKLFFGAIERLAPEVIEDLFQAVYPVFRALPPDAAPGLNRRAFRRDHQAIWTGQVRDDPELARKLADPKLARKLGPVEWPETRLFHGKPLRAKRFKGQWERIFDLVHFPHAGPPQYVRRAEVIVPGDGPGERKTFDDIREYHFKYLRTRTGGDVLADADEDLRAFLEATANPHGLVFSDHIRPVSPEEMQERQYNVTAESVDYAIEEWAIRWNLLEPRVQSRDPSSPMAVRGANPRPHDPEQTREPVTDVRHWKFGPRPTWISFFVTWVIPVAWATIRMWREEEMRSAPTTAQRVAAPVTPRWRWRYPDPLPGSATDTSMDDGLRAIVLKEAAGILGVDFDENEYWRRIMARQDAEIYGRATEPEGAEPGYFARGVEGPLWQALWRFTDRRKADARRALKSLPLVKGRTNVSVLLNRLEAAARPLVRSSPRPQRGDSKKAAYYIYYWLTRYQVLGESPEHIARHQPYTNSRDDLNRPQRGKTSQRLEKVAQAVRQGAERAGREVVGPAWPSWKISLPSGHKTSDPAMTGD